MYRPVVIYCLIAVGWVGTVSAVYFNDNREARQENMNYVQPAVQSAAQPSAQPHVQPTSTPYPYVTYPDYSQKTLSPNPTATTAITVPSSSTESFFDSMVPYTRNVVEFSTKAGSFLLQALGVAFIGQTIVGVVCSFTPVCKSLLSEARTFGPLYVSSKYLNELTPVITKAIDVFSNIQKEVQEEVKNRKVKE